MSIPLIPTVTAIRMHVLTAVTTTAGSTAAADTVAPQRQIVPDMSDDTVFQGSDDVLSLPFPIDDDTGNISF